MKYDPVSPVGEKMNLFIRCQNTEQWFIVLTDWILQLWESYHSGNYFSFITK